MVYLKKRAWSPEEDRRLISYISKYGIWNWSQMPKFVGLARTGKSCRLRWINYLRPDVKRGPFSVEEVEVIVRLFLSFGHRWSAIAAQLPGRTDNDIKNFYHAHLKKHMKAAVNDAPVSRRTAPAAAENGRKKATNNINNKKKNNAVMPAEEKPRHDQRGGTNTSLVVLDSNNNPDNNGFGNPSFAHDQQLHNHHFSSSSSAGMDIMSLSLEDYDEIKSFWYNLLNQAEDLKF